MHEDALAVESAATPAAARDAPEQGTEEVAPSPPTAGAAPLDVPVADASRCAGCGAELREAARFCGRCGKRVAHADDAEAARAPRRIGLGLALTYYFAFLAIILPLLAIGASLSGIDVADWLALGLALTTLAAAPRQMLPLLRPPRLTAAGVALSVGAVAAVFGYVQLAASFAPSLFTDDVIIAYLLDGRSLVATLLSMAVLPVVAEELLFRGVILEGLLSVFDRRAAIITSAALFVTIHLSPLNILHIGALGLLFAVVRLRTGSIYPSMLLHGAYNAAITLAAWPT